MWQLGFYRQHTIDLWVLGRWKLQEFALGKWAETHGAVWEQHLCVIPRGVHPQWGFKYTSVVRPVHSQSIFQRRKD